ncbi:unnamed protein product [Prunus armeniaca]|uniref:Uncharacterized protein n=1 Tax=Prunus armeniaca TaxID=36596 RepID=A0A6J5UAP4_PRUAR|nr:unnamed protein product [Prunus armeniaca]CAB4304018.1 unnamed protein product [Prunus armeniaca]
MKRMCWEFEILFFKTPKYPSPTCVTLLRHLLSPQPSLSLSAQRHRAFQANDRLCQAVGQEKTILSQLSWLDKEPATLGYTAAVRARRRARGFGSFRRCFRAPLSSIKFEGLLWATIKAGDMWQLMGHY